MSVPTSQNIIGVGNYVYSLLGAKLQLANQILSNGSGGVVPSPTPGGSGLSPYPINITIDSSHAGLTYYQDNSLRGVSQSNLVLLTINSTPFQVGTQFLFNSAQGLINFDLTTTSGNKYTLQLGDLITGDSYITVT